MKKLILLSMLLLTIIVTAGCAEEGAQPTPVFTSTPESTPTATPATTPPTTPETTPVPSPALFLEITHPADGAQVSTSSISVTGKTIPHAVVSVSVDDNLEMADVDQNGYFSVTVTLEEGPNFIEVVASDQEGNEKSTTITVIYVS